MKTFTRHLLMLLIVMAGCFGHSVLGQSILNPADTIVNYDPNHPPTQPAYGTIGKWVRTPRVGFNTNQYKCYIYKGIQFRLLFPKSYNPTAVDGKKYPMLAFYHGVGEASSTPYDNEYQLYHGGDVFLNAVNNGTFDGYVIAMQTAGGWGEAALTPLTEIIDYMVANNKLDAFHVCGNGLSGGGGGTWQMFLDHPTYNAGIIPMSAVDIAYAQSSTVNLVKFEPIWNMHGGLDGSPAPSSAQVVTSAMQAAGANYVDKNYVTLGHDTWDSTWQEPDFWPFLNRAYASNPWPLFGRTQFCPTDAINVTVGLTPGYSAYQWRKDSVLIPGDTTNSITVTAIGRYDARVKRGGIWSDWSHTPVIISIKTPTVTPPITVSGLMSDVIPGGDGKNFVNLQVPDSGYTSYTWKKVGSDSVVGTTRILSATKPGQYIVSVTQQFGCSSIYSPPFRVVNANGTNAPSPASNLVTNVKSFTQIELDWARNPSPAFNETGFEIYRSLSPGGPYTFTGLVPADTVRFVDNGLKPNTKYYYVVRAIDSTAAAALSNEAAGITTSDKTPPTAPGNLKTVSTSQSSVTLAWTPSTDNVSISNYLIYVNGVKSYSAKATDSTYIVGGLSANTQYSFYVVALDGSGNASANSNQVSAASVFNGLTYKYYTTATGWSVLPDFTTLTPTLTGNMPNVSIANATQTINYGYVWQGYIRIPVAGSYIFSTSSDDGSALWFNTQTPTGTPTVNNDGLHGTQAANSTALNLQPGVYPICIEFFQNGGGAVMGVSWACSALFGDNNQHTIADTYFASPFTPAGTAPAIPTHLVATATAYNKVNITWTDNSNNETGFEVYRANASGGTYTIVSTTGANATSFTDSTAQAATTYYYEVQAINKYGSSGFDASSAGGITYALYNNFTASNLSTLPSLTPTATGTLPNVSLSPATTTTNYAFKYQGVLNIPTSGSYTFYTSSDDGSNLYIGGFDSAHLVVKNDFLQGATERSGTITLAPGAYPIYVTYFQQGGGVALTVSYAGPGISKQAIPNTAFVNPNSRATTFGLPAIPSKPYNVTVSALSASQIRLSWQDSSATATGFQILRSVGDATHFIQIASPAGTTSYTDTALFSNLTYYYKVVATGVGGNSDASAVFSAMTKDNLPVIVKLAAQSARYGTTTTVPVSATSVNSGALVFTASGLPPFATFTDHGDRTGVLTLNPASTDQGNYTNLSIVVTDVFGGTDTTRFNLNVNNNYTPAIDTIPSYTINENDTLTIPLTAHENNPANALTFSATNLPSPFTLTSSANGVASLFVHPGFAGAGVYNVQVKVADANGLSTTRTFGLTVKDKDPNSKVYMRMFIKDSVGAPWNSLTGPTMTGFKDDGGSVTTMGLTINPWWWFTGFDAGPVTGNNSGIYPDAVLKDFYIYGTLGGPDTINVSVTGLDTTQVYDLTFFASSVLNWYPDNGTSTYRVGNQTVSLAVQNNTQNTVTISNIKAAADGTIPFTMGKAPGTTAGYFNALVVTKHFDDGSAPVKPTALSLLNASGTVQLNWASSAYNATGFQVWRAPASTGVYSLVGTAPGNSARTYTDSNITSNTKYFYKLQAINTHGVSGYGDSASITTLTRMPKINAIADIALKNNQPQTVQVTTVDDSTAQLTLTATNLPPFVTFTDNGNGTGVLNITPTGGTVGVFPGVTVTVTDGLDSSVSTSFTIAVTEPNVSSVYVNFADGSMPAPKPWNTMVGAFAGATLSNLLDDSNNPTTLSVKLVNGFSWTSATGMRPRNGHAIYPEAVTRNSVYEPSTTVRTIQVAGLNPAKKYNIVLFSSNQDGLSALTKFTINGQSISQQACYNVDKTVQFNGLSGDANGQITISVAKDTGASNAFLNALVIQSYDSVQSLLLNPSDLRVISKGRTTAAIQWQDRSANETGFQVWRASDSTGSYAQIASLPANTTSYKDKNLSANSTYYYIVRAVNSTTQSNYSNIASLTTYSYQVYLNFTATSEAPAPWNNLNAPPQVGFIWNNFVDSLGAATSVGMTVTAPFAGVQSLGDVTGNNSGVYPDLVMLDDYILFPGTIGGLQLTGLNLSLNYDMTFLASTTSWGDNTTAFAVGSDTVLLDASLNTQATVTMYNKSADGNGNLALNVLPYTSNSQGGLINAWVVQGYMPSTKTAPALPVSTGGNQTQVTTRTAASLSQQAQQLSADSVISAYPNPFQQFFTLTVPADNGDRIQVGIYDANGKLVYNKEFDNLVQGDNYLRIEPNHPLTSGIYFARVAYSNGKTTRTIKLMKQ